MTHLARDQAPPGPNNRTLCATEEPESGYGLTTSVPCICGWIEQWKG